MTLELFLRGLCHELDVSLQTEFKFHPVRKFRFDFAVIPLKVAVEYDGGVFSGGRHTQGVGYSNDAVKGNLALESGWKVYHVTSRLMEPKRVAETLNRLEVIIRAEAAKAKRGAE